MLLILFLILYPMLCNSSVKLTDCMEIDGENKLRSEPSLTCFEGSLAVWNYFGFAMIIFGLIGVLVFIFVHLWRMVNSVRSINSRKMTDTDLNRLMSKTSKRIPSMWSLFLHGDLLTTRFYYGFFIQGIVLLLTVMSSYDIKPLTSTIVSIVIFLIVCVLYIVKLPFISIDKWKIIPLVSLLFVSGLASLLNALAYEGMTESSVDIFGGIILILLVLFSIVSLILFIRSILKRSEYDAKENERAMQMRKRNANGAPHGVMNPGALNVNPMLPPHLAHQSSRYLNINGNNNNSNNLQRPISLNGTDNPSNDPSMVKTGNPFYEGIRSTRRLENPRKKFARRDSSMKRHNFQRDSTSPRVLSSNDFSSPEMPLQFNDSKSHSERNFSVNEVSDVSQPQEISLSRKPSSSVISLSQEIDRVLAQQPKLSATGFAKQLHHQRSKTSSEFQPENQQSQRRQFARQRSSMRNRMKSKRDLGKSLLFWKLGSF
eukprot:TRINITY_DN1251_c0_g2_i1.p1 TRINITY_DN1251_c0_g2~~TRINITY_DN1251_c0_g2_i1.p1  ORF type:complete len:502 (+),score=121.14 TRINITY_DN1251_c0_g2_i1:49-1506(+)